MKTREIKGVPSNEVIWNIVEPENDLDLKVMELLVKCVMTIEQVYSPDRAKDFKGKICLHVVDGEVKPMFLHMAENQEEADKVISKLNLVDTEQTIPNEEMDTIIKDEHV